MEWGRGEGNIGGVYAYVDNDGKGGFFRRAYPQSRTVAKLGRFY